MITKSSNTVTLNPLEIRQNLALSQEGMSRLLRVSAKTIGRWEKGETKPDAQLKQPLAKLQQIVELGHAVYTPEGLREFMETPLGVFDGQCALDLITIGQYDRVIGVLASDYEGLGF